MAAEQYKSYKDYEPRLLKCSYGTLLGSLIVVALLVLPARAGAAAETYSANDRTVGAGNMLGADNMSWGLNHTVGSSCSGHTSVRHAQ